MKRSEAIQLIKNHYKKHFKGICYAGYLDGELTKKAESLLDLVETQIKMLPPRTELDKLKPHTDNAWEPEE